MRSASSGVGLTPPPPSTAPLRPPIRGPFVEEEEFLYNLRRSKEGEARAMMEGARQELENEGARTQVVGRG